ncbi:MAG: amidohydrolase family protein [Thioalkalispiraceae bacterium]|jgi:mannonate dehydratase
MKLSRRNLLKMLGMGLAGGALAYQWPHEGLLNPCPGTPIPDTLLNHDVVLSAWDGINPVHFRDVHTHLLGAGDGDSGIYLHPTMQDIFTPAQYIRFKFYMNASCAENVIGIDKGYMQQLTQHLAAFPSGAKAMLLAFEFNHDQHGIANKDKSPFATPNAYVKKIVEQNPARFEWIASIHPYREDSVDELEKVVNSGAKAIKWLPPVMGIDPSSPKCDRFYEALAKLDIPLLTHAGDEHAVHGVELQANGNPLLLRRALEHGVRVIVAHCASEGVGVDLDKGNKDKSISNFELFARLMDDKRYEGRLFGEISAMTQLNRIGPALETILERDDWHHRLLNGSDYPLPGVMPLFSTQTLHDTGLLEKKLVEPLMEIRRFNPILYDFVLKRHLSWKGSRLSPTIFESQSFFEQNKTISTG